MVSAELFDLLRQHAFLQGLTDAQLERLAGCASRIEVRSGAMLAREGEAADYFYLVLTGRFAIETSFPDRSPITLQTVEEGEVIGWSWIDANPWLFDIRALTECTCIALQAEQIMQLLHQDQGLGLEIMRRLNRVMTQRLRATRLQLLDLFGGGQGA